LVTGTANAAVSVAGHFSFTGLSLTTRGSLNV
jgi:hypothetical protein